MQPVYAVLLIILAALLTYVLTRGHFASQVRDLARQLREIRENKMRNTILLKNHAAADLEPLIREMNLDIEEHRNTVKMQEKSEDNLRQHISDLSHDLRTPLTSLKGYLALLKENAADQDLLTLAEKRTETLHHLVENIYELSRYEDPGFRLTLYEQNPRVILEDQVLALYNEFQDSGLVLELNLETDQAVLLSRPELERVYQNLLKNAIRYAHSYLRIDHGVNDAGKVYTRFTNDLSNQQLAGLQKKGAASLFERFYTADASRTGGASGLGLYLAKLLAERMGANLEAEIIQSVSPASIVFTLTHPRSN